MITHETRLSICYIIVHNNYAYNDPSLLNNNDYKKIMEFYKYKSSRDIVSQLMITINTKSDT